MSERKYKFHWDVISRNVDVARPILGSTTRVEIYRLFQFTLRDVLEQHYGADQTDNLLREAGVMAGNEFYDKFCKDVADLNELVKAIQDNFKDLGIGIFRVERADVDTMKFTMTVDEDLDCSGLPDTDEQICVYDEGFIQGILEAFTGKFFDVKEIDCWCTGSRTCRFSAVMK
ncbi:MAG: 4-vinyl reductase [Desulfomicrobium sp.]|jgi:predicted hydrocarbon binding protein|nr:4-vinyl reductase [Desulfomicrobium sp.]NLV96916.1 4-vinyl reductase [Desulfovibrionales bacterium]